MMEILEAISRMEDALDGHVFDGGMIERLHCFLSLSGQVLAPVLLLVERRHLGLEAVSGLTGSLVVHKV